MKYLKFIYAALFVYFLLYAAPALAQFEISPDHFDGPATANKNTVSPNKRAARKAGKKQLAADTGKALPVGSAVNTAATSTNGALTTRRQKAWAASSLATAPSLKAQASAAHHE